MRTLANHGRGIELLGGRIPSKHRLVALDVIGIEIGAGSQTSDKPRLLLNRFSDHPVATLSLVSDD